MCNKFVCVCLVLSLLSVFQMEQSYSDFVFLSTVESGQEYNLLLADKSLKRSVCPVFLWLKEALVLRIKLLWNLS